MAAPRRNTPQRSPGPSRPARRSRTSRSTRAPAWRRSRKLRLRPPSNRITATASLTIGSINGPKSSSGRIRPSIGPAITPTISISAIAGRPVRQAIHCAPMPRTPISAILTISESNKGRYWETIVTSYAWTRGNRQLPRMSGAFRIDMTRAPAQAVPGPLHGVGSRSELAAERQAVSPRFSEEGGENLPPAGELRI